MKPQNTGLVTLHDDKQKERGFNCMKLIQFLTAASTSSWEEWHEAHLQAAAGQCRYADQCPIYARTPKRPTQLSLFHQPQ